MISKEKIKKKVKELLNGEKRLKIIVAIGLIGIALIFMSTLFEGGDEDNKDEAVPNDIVSTDTSAYKKQLEKELYELLSRISGVGEVKVMITIEGTTEDVYAEELSTDKNVTSDKTSESYENKIVVVENNGNKEALVRKIVKPQVSGVAIVCQGGDNLSVQERVYKAVSTVLNIPTSRICVAPLSK